MRSWRRFCREQCRVQFQAGTQVRCQFELQTPAEWASSLSKRVGRPNGSAQPSPLAAAPDKPCMRGSVADGAAWSKERGEMARWRSLRSWVGERLCHLSRSVNCEVLIQRERSKSKLPPLRTFSTSTCPGTSAMHSSWSSMNRSTPCETQIRPFP